MSVRSDTPISEDLYTKIALDNKLATKFQLRKASEEQAGLESDGQRLVLGEVLVRMGFLTDRQHQSILNACSYREQRDHDKRFGRQCLRMELLDQSQIESGLGVQKNEYSQSGEVRPLSEILVEQGRLDTSQVEAVEAGIRQRDQAREIARSGKHPALNVSGPTTIVRTVDAGGEVDLAEETGEFDLEEAVDVTDLEDDDGDLDEVDLDELEDDDDDDDEFDDLEGDLDDLDDDDEISAEGAAEEAAGLRSEDLDEDDLEDISLSDVDIDDLDDDDDDDAEISDDVSDLGDVDLEDDSDLGDLDDVNLDDDNLDDDLDDDDDEFAGLAAAAAGTAEAVEDDESEEVDLGAAEPDDEVDLESADLESADLDDDFEDAGQAAPAGSSDEFDELDAGEAAVAAAAPTAALAPQPDADNDSDNDSDLGLDDVDLDDDMDSDLDLDDVDLDEELDSDEGGALGEDEADLADALDDDADMDGVELDDSDLQAVRGLTPDSGIDGDWAEEAFDDRPLDKRPVSERLEQQPAADWGDDDDELRSPPPLPVIPNRPRGTPQVPAAAGSGRASREAVMAKAAPTTSSDLEELSPSEAAGVIDTVVEAQAQADAYKRELFDAQEIQPDRPSEVGAQVVSEAIPGGDVFEGDLSGEAPARLKGLDAAALAAPPAPNEQRSPIKDDDLDDPDLDADFDESDLDDIDESDLLEGLDDDDGIRPQPSPADTVASSAPTTMIEDAPAPAPEPEPAPRAVAEQAAARHLAQTAPTNGDPSQDPRLRRAFERAMEAAWKVFLEELQRPDQAGE